MREEDILSEPNRVLTQEERKAFFDDGYVVKKSIISNEWLTKLNSALDDLIDKSRSLTKSDGTFVLENGHSAENPRLRRIAFLMSSIQFFMNF